MRGLSGYAQGLLGITAELERGSDAAGSSLQRPSQAIKETVNDFPFRAVDPGNVRVKGVNVDIAVSPKRLSAFTASLG